MSERIKGSAIMQQLDVSMLSVSLQIIANNLIRKLHITIFVDCDR